MVIRIKPLRHLKSGCSVVAMPLAMRPDFTSRHPEIGGQIYRNVAPGETLQSFVLDCSKNRRSFSVITLRCWQRATLSRDFRKKVRSCISLIEATALHWDLTVVTHNTSDFVQARTLNLVAIGMTK